MQKGYHSQDSLVSQPRSAGCIGPSTGSRSSCVQFLPKKGTRARTFVYLRPPEHLPGGSLCDRCHSTRWQEQKIAVRCHSISIK